MSAGQSAEASDARQLHRIGRALRALRLSGRRLLERNGRWEVRANGRRRPAATLFPEDVNLLAADERIIAAAGGGYVLTASAVEEITATEPEESPRAGPWIYVADGKRRPATYGAGFAGLGLRAQNGEGPLTLRQAMAGLRLVADAEHAGRDHTLTMNWDAGPVDRRRRDGRAPLRAGAARDADQRLRRARASLGDAFALLWSACVEQLPLSRLEHRHRLPPRTGAKALAAALEKLAEVYDASRRGGPAADDDNGSGASFRDG